MAEKLEVTVNRTDHVLTILGKCLDEAGKNQKSWSKADVDKFLKDCKSADIKHLEEVVFSSFKIFYMDGKLRLPWDKR